MELAPRIHKGNSEGRTVPRSRADSAHSLGSRFRRNCVSFKIILIPPFGTGPLSISMNLHKQFRRVSRRCDTGVEQKVLMLGQVLGWGLLGSPGTVQQLSLQQGQVGLEKWNHEWTKRKVCSLLELTMEFFNCHC